MIGSAVNDTYHVDQAGDVVEENFTSTQSVDRVRDASTVSFTLGARTSNTWS